MFHVKHLPPMLAKVLKMLPEIRPGRTQGVTQVNGPVIDRFFVLDVERRGNRCDPCAVLEIGQKVG